MLQTYGFNGPHDDRTMTVDKGYVSSKLRCLVDQMKELTNGRGVSSADADPMRAVAIHLRQHWHITPQMIPRSNRYSLKACEPKWPKPSWESHLRYDNFLASLNDRQ